MPSSDCADIVQQYSFISAYMWVTGRPNKAAQMYSGSMNYASMQIISLCHVHGIAEFLLASYTITSTSPQLDNVFTMHMGPYVF